MGRFDDISDAAKERVEEAREAVHERASATVDATDDVHEQLTGSIDDLRAKLGGVQTEVRNPLVEPAVRTESTLTGEKRYYSCAHCETEYGPVEEKQYRNLLKPAFNGLKTILGVATGNPVLALKGGVGTTEGVGEATTTDDSGLFKLPHRRIAELKQNRAEGAEFLTQCPACGEWVCLDCWDETAEVCVECANKRTDDSPDTQPD